MSDDTLKCCSRCSEYKSLDLFYRHPYGREGRQSHCMACRRSILQERRAANPGLYAERDARHRQQARAWHAAHPGQRRAIDARFRAAHRERRSAATAAWAQANPERVYERNAMYRARKQAGHVTRVSRRAIYARDGGKCGICGKPVPFKAMHLDHITPLVHGGAHEPKNVQVAHARCNNRKYSTGPGQLRLLE